MGLSSEWRRSKLSSGLDNTSIYCSIFNVKLHQGSFRVTCHNVAPISPLVSSIQNISQSSIRNPSPFVKPQSSTNP